MTSPPVADIWLWILGSLFTLNLLVLTVLGKFIRDTYDVATDIDAFLNGTNREQEGFVREQRKFQKTVTDEHDEMRERMQAQARLVEELTHASQDLAEAIDEMNGHDVDTDRLDSAHDDFSDSRSS